MIRAVGKPKEDWQKEALKEYQKRLSAFAKIEAQEVPEGHGGAKKPDTQKTISKEAESLLASLPGNAFVIALDETGKNLSSEDFAKRIEVATEGGRPVIFLIGGSWGLDETVRERANLVLSFGKETLPHMLARIVLMEQIYRVETILKGKTYHK